ncbi:MAG: hypothetical protein JXR58_01855 [Bacteroidales bacterium]|nr:hypothetical protein [Bacteroidales bacterium]
MRTVFIIGVVLFLSFNCFSQKKIEVEENSYSFSAGRENALTVTVYESNKDDVEKAWKKFIKNYKGKVSSKKEIFADDCEIKDVSPNTVDVYAAFEVNKDGDVTVYVGFDLGGAYLSSSSHPDKYKAAKKIVREFGVSATKDAIAEKLKEAEKVMKKLESDKEKLVKENETLHKNIEGWEKDIEKAKSDIKTNEGNQQDKTKEIETQQKVLEEIIEKEKKVE